MVVGCVTLLYLILLRCYCYSLLVVVLVFGFACLLVLLMLDLFVLAGGWLGFRLVIGFGFILVVVLVCD